jgi:hypothetical protein
VITFPPVPDGEAVTVSGSTYVAFRQCPAQAHARFQSIYSPESKASFAGALAHRIFARHLRSGPIDDLGQAAREEIGAALNPKLVALALRPSQLDEIIRQVGGLYERFRRFPTEGFETAEIELMAEPASGVTLLGKIDAVYRDGANAVLRDWKTGNLGEPIDQLLFYALVWSLARDEPAAMVEAISLLTGERVTRSPSPPELQEVAGQVAALVTALRTTWIDGHQIERRGGPWCRFCPLRDDCPEGRSATFATG